MTRLLPLAGFCCLVLAACKKDGQVPSYAEFDAPMVADANGAGISSRITDLWVYVNDQPAGVWEPGRPVPLIASGNSNVKLIAGVRRNGVINDRIQYPFYATWQQQMDLVPGQTRPVSPQFRYYDNLVFWIADFNTGQRFDTLDCTATMELVPSDSTLLGQGSHYGRISLDPSHGMYRGVSSGDPFTTTTGAFLEMDYRSDTRLLIGVRYMKAGVQYDSAYLYVMPTKRGDGSMPWNKIYIDIAEPWNQSAATDKRFYLKAELEGGATAGRIDVDNIKIVRR